MLSNSELLLIVTHDLCSQHLELVDYVIIKHQRVDFYFYHVFKIYKSQTVMSLVTLWETHTYMTA